jgi:hypothetical protein
MRTLRHYFLIGFPLLGIMALALTGPIAQSQEFHAFADMRAWGAIPNAADVLSNLPFLFAGLWGLLRIEGVAPPLRPLAALLCVAIALTSFGSAYYHWDPQNFGLMIDRIPISLACATITLILLADRVSPAAAQPLPMIVLPAVAVATCVFWYFTEQAGAGDLRPYIVIQALPILLVPLLTLLYPGGQIRSATWWSVLLLYALAKLCEGLDHQIFEFTQIISGHTLKHLFAAAAAFVLIRALVKSNDE